MEKEKQEESYKKILHVQSEKIQYYKSNIVENSLRLKPLLLEVPV